MLNINDYSVIFSFVFTWKKYVNINVDRCIGGKCFDEALGSWSV